MISTTLRRCVAAAALTVAAGGFGGLAASPAVAATPSGIPAGAVPAAAAETAPLCRDADVRASATDAADHPSGHHAVVLHYTAANPDTHCTLSGAPYGAVFYDGPGHPNGITSTTASGEPEQVTIDSTHAASSFILIPTMPQPGDTAVTALGFHLPSDASRTAIGVAWPGSEVTGTPQFTTITQD